VPARYNGIRSLPVFQSNAMWPPATHRDSPPPPVPSRDHPWVGQMIAFTGDSRCAVAGRKLDREASQAFARSAGMVVHERVTKKVQLLVDCDDGTVSGNQRKALEYGIPVVEERDFWTAIGLTTERT
jgi:NAD-dependent DNA ligase